LAFRKLPKIKKVETTHLLDRSFDFFFLPAKAMVYQLQPAFAWTFARSKKAISDASLQLRFNAGPTLQSPRAPEIAATFLKP
jgi:hypothetical protein